jgi:hypothetical protein
VAEELVKLLPLMPKRTSQQCNQHWMRVLSPDIVKGRWTLEEDSALLEGVGMLGEGNWHNVSLMMKGRTDTQVRYRYTRI